MIEIVEVEKEEAMDFNEEEWKDVNEEHFGKGVVWNTTMFAYKAVQNDETLSLLFGKHESGTIYVSNIIVRKDRRRQGIGTMLMQKAEEFGKTFGDHKIWLISGKHYSEDKFFESIGFSKEALLPNLFFHKDFIVYVKEIV